ncbi:MAG: hypothetical protein ACR2I0_07130 [Rhodoferax sp.]
MNHWRKLALASVFIASMGAGAVGATDAAAAQPHYTPKAGETLDQIIAKTMADSPLRIEILRQAFVQANPKAFEPGKGKALPQRVRKGATLTLPDAQALLQSYLPTAAADDAPQAAPQAALDASIERKRWVRFP